MNLKENKLGFLSQIVFLKISAKHIFNITNSRYKILAKSKKKFTP